jgi:hypothetical protein
LTNQKQELHVAAMLKSVSFKIISKNIFPQIIIYFGSVVSEDEQ